MGLLKNNIRKFYILSFFNGCMFAYVIERLYWESRGISILQVVWIEMIYSGVVLALELPTGMFADRFSRRNWIILEAVMNFIAFIILIYAHSFWLFALAIVLQAVGNAFYSGAHNALLYDSMKVLGNTAGFEKVLGRIRAFDYIGAMISGIIGGILASQFSLVSAYWWTLVPIAIAIMAAISIKEVRVDEIKKEPWDMSDWKEIFKFMIHKKYIRFVVVIGTLFGAVITYLDEFWQVYLQGINLPIIYFGAVFTILFIVGILAGLIVDYIKKKIGFDRAMKIIYGGTTLCFVYIGFMRNIWGILGIMAAYFCSTIAEPLIYGYLHEHALPKYRATIESAFSLTTKLMVMIIGIPFGLLSSNYNIFIGFLYLAGILLLIFIYYVTMKKKNLWAIN